MSNSTIKIPGVKVFSSIACCFLISWLTACSGSKNQRTLLGYVPSSSHAVVAVNWRTVRRDPDLKRISKGAEVEKLFTKLGLNEETVTEFAVYGNHRASAQGSKGLIAKGNYDSNEIVKKLVQVGWTERDIEGRRVYINPDDASWLTTFEKDLVAFGTESAVRDAIDARKKSENRFTANPVYKLLSSRFESKQYPILMMVALPQASQDMANAAVQLTSTALDLAGVGPLGDLLTKIGYAQGLGCAISHKDESFPVVVSAVMKDEESARFVSGALELLKNFGGMASRNYSSQTNNDAARALETMSIERIREVVSIKMLMSRRDLGAINR